MGPTAERNYSKLEWFFYIIILPIIFISILTVTLLWFLDFDNEILEKLNHIPVIEKLIDDEQFNNNDILSINNSKEQFLETIDTLKKTITDKDSVIAETEKKVTLKDEEINLLKQQIEDLEAKLEAKKSLEQSRQERMAELAKIYANMNPQNAANIISNLSYEEAILILEQMNVDSKSSILEKMDQEKAAELTKLTIDLAE